MIYLLNKHLINSLLSIDIIMISL